MKQAVMTEPGKIEFREVEKPGAGPDQVMIKIMRIGICGSDIHVFHGKHPYTSYPVVQGHEVSGQIVEIGSNVRNFAIGDKVTIQPQVFCGECYSCRHGNYHICDHLKVMGFQTTGTASEYFAVDASKALKLSDSMSYEEGAMDEPLAVVAHALRRTTEVIGKKILVLGAGPIGNLAAQAAMGLGAEATLITDISDYRLSVAEKCLIPFRVNPNEQKLDDALVDFFGSDKADVIFECVGTAGTIDQAITLARKGTDIIVVGVFGEKPKVDMGLVQDHELRLIGTLMYQERDFLTAIDLIERSKVRVSPLISASFSFSEYLKAYQYIDNQKNRSMKVMINVQEER